ncbi:hypothetical protein MP228_005487 [Amoeboaphelidium protococcarum]|nr:hypothetical protein MP228_005487 [Amoeboaphelidium protococcarum]
MIKLNLLILNVIILCIALTADAGIFDRFKSGRDSVSSKGGRRSQQSRQQMGNGNEIGGADEIMLPQEDQFEDPWSMQQKKPGFRSKMKDLFSVGKKKQERTLQMSGFDNMNAGSDEPTGTHRLNSGRGPRREPTIPEDESVDDQEMMQRYQSLGGSASEVGSSSMSTMSAMSRGWQKVKQAPSDISSRYKKYKQGKTDKKEAKYAQKRASIAQRPNKYAECLDWDFKKVSMLGQSIEKLGRQGYQVITQHKGKPTLMGRCLDYGHKKNDGEQQYGSYERPASRDQGTQVNFDSFDQGY